MCGFAGIIQAKSGTACEQELRQIVESMANAISHRGPDDHGTWADESTQVAFGFRRLAILDLSPNGRQPMPSFSGRFTMVFNGEIYNFKDIRNELKQNGRQIPYRGDSDTEVLLAAIETWGLKEAIQRSVGMFAFAIWDSQRNELTLGRDRLGEKPLYYGDDGNGGLIFGSELKALQANQCFKPTLHREVITSYLRHGYVPSPHSILNGINKLPPGSLLTISRLPNRPPEWGEPELYWSPHEILENTDYNSFSMNDKQATDRLDELLQQTIQQQMIADVPLGAFLSGGVDSSLIVGLMQSQSRIPVKTFSIGFQEDKFNEAHYAKAVAKHLNTDHTELYVTPDEIRNVIPKIAELYDEPFADSSQLPTFLVSKLARQHVTVSLSGDGGDELFGGYNRYLAGQRLWNRIKWVPWRLRKTVGRLLMPLSDGSRYFSLPRKLYAAGKLLDEPTRSLFYRSHIASGPMAKEIGLNTPERSTAFNDWRSAVQVPDFLRQMMYLDMVSYLPDDIMVKVDRATMGVSLESRAPLLDHRIVEFSLSLPNHFLVRDNKTKWLLRQVLYRYVPSRLIDRPKKGFSVPLGIWLRDPLRDWADSLLNEHDLRNDGIFDAAIVRRVWNEHQTGKHDRSAILWFLLVFQMWKTRWL